MFAPPRMRPGAWCAALVGLSGLLFTACNGQEEPESSDTAGDAPAQDSDAGSGGSESESGTETGGEGQDAQPIGVFRESCEQADALLSGHYQSSLRGRQEALGGACGLGGPQLFFAVEADQDLDLRIEAVATSFEPRLEWVDTECIEGRSYACSASGRLELSNLRAGTRLVASVGIDPDNPVLLDEDSQDPLAFELALFATPVLASGQVCGEHVPGRCIGGTRCEPSSDALQRCEPVEGDNCARALALTLPEAGESLDLELDVDEAAPSDQHA